MLAYGVLIILLIVIGLKTLDYLALRMSHRAVELTLFGSSGEQSTGLTEEATSFIKKTIYNQRTCLNRLIVMDAITLVLLVISLVCIARKVTP
jgi:hypothetical protein